jgi:hypothetical protein
MSDARTSLDTMIQGSAVDLFHSCGLAVAPVARAQQRSQTLPTPEIGGMISFVGRGFTGTLTVAVSPAVFALIKQDPTRPYSGRDWVREMTNQLLGRIKSRLLQFRVTLQAGLPTVMGSDALERQRARDGLFAAYTFRTLRGDVLITLSGDIDPSIFVYTGTTPGAAVATEGDVILF